MFTHVPQHVYASVLTHMNIHTHGLKHKYINKSIHLEWLETFLFVSMVTVLAVLATSSHGYTGKLS